MRVDIVDVASSNAGAANGGVHAAKGAIAVLGGRGDVKGIAREPIADEFAVDARATPLGMLVFFKHHGAGALAHDKSVAVAVVRPRRAFGRVVEAGRQRPAGRKSGQRNAVDRRFRTAGHHYLGIAKRNQPAGIADRSAYNASKHGLIGLTRTLAAEWGARGVRVNAVCPGWVKTEMDVADQAGGGYTDDDITGRVPMARFASPNDIACAILFLADPAQSGFVNGHALAVDGGWTADGSWQSLRTHKR